MEDRWGTPPSVEDRLSALRSAAPTAARATATHIRKRRTWREVLLGLALILVGCVLALFLVDRGGGIPTAGVPEPTTVPAGPSRPGEGMALFAALVEAGAYPPSIQEGDRVMVVVRPEPSSDSVTRALPDLATVTQVSDASAISGGVVVSMLGPESMSRDIADAAEVHLSVVGGGQ